VVYEIHEEKHYVVGRVRIAGNTITRDRVNRRDVALLPGQPLRLEELETTRQRLLEDANVASAQVRTVQGDGPNVADIEVSIEERRHIGTLEVGGGADAGAGEVGYIRVHQPNLDLFRWPRSATDWEGAFQGGGQELELELIPGTKESEYRARFVEPYFFRSDFSFSITGGTAYYDRRTYSEDHIKGAAAIQKFFDRGHRLSLALGYIADAVRVHDLDDDAPADAFDVEGRTFLAYPRLELRLREASRDFFSGPRGFSGLLRLDAAGDVTGSEVDFTRALATLDWSMGFFARIPELEHVLHVGAAFGWMEGRGEPVPLYERFYLGGPRTFPGFEYRRLGPHDGKTPVGGEGDVHGVVDYSFPFLRPEVRPFAIFEWGDLEPALSQISTERFRTAVGGGLQLRFKIAGQLIPANLYWVKALASEPEDREELFSFTLGINF
ncbi:MAG TPA: BamA/TamA family outer membrane protein, partial [Planctomycetota bacterium]|nr:BamA/TamA family outer membrane protein [Planctomycetota bacterium]